MKLHLTLAAVLAATALSACAKPAETQQKAADAKAATAMPAHTPSVAVTAGTPEARAVEAIRKLGANIVVDKVGPAPIPGFRELIVGGQTVYVSDDGNYLLQGSLFDINAKKDLSQATMAELRKSELAKIPAGQRIIFAPQNPKYTVTVFTDVECGYCRKLHSEIAQYNAQGIAVEYLAFPRNGLASEDFKEMEAVWCSPDRKKALTDSKNGKRVTAARCTTPVATHYALGQKLGLQGTPMIIASNGIAAPGYLAPAALRQWLDAVVK